MKMPTLLAAVAALLILLGTDPYSYGYRGGDVYVTKYPWQPWFVGVQVVLLAIAANRARRSFRNAFTPLSIEAAVFVGANAIYVARDGLTRFVTGYESTPTLLWVLGAGLALRGLLLTTTASAGRGQSEGSA